MSQAAKRMKSLNNAGMLIPEEDQVVFEIANPSREETLILDEEARTSQEVAKTLASLLRALEDAGIISTAISSRTPPEPERH